jgi:tetratricopeptide (TPR) repeat protein
MARRRLNKKVALIGSVIFVFLTLSAILLFLYLSRDPEKFIKDGDESLAAAREASDKEVKEQEYKRAERSYHKARSLAETDSLKIEMLFKLVDLYIETDQWRNVLGCWNMIIQIDPKNIKARFGKLKYIYIMADSTGSQLWQWQEVESQASDFIKVIEDMNLPTEDIAKWDYPVIQETAASVKHLGPYLYQRRGRANLEIAKLGAVTDPNTSLSKAIDDLEKAKELEPNNVDTYLYLAQAIVTQGDILASKGYLEARDEGRKQAKELFEQASEKLGTDVKAHIITLAMKSMFAQAGGMEQIKALEPEYLSLVKQFDSSAQAFATLAGFYSRLGHKYLDKAIEAIERAVELDRENVIYAITAANMHYQRFSIYDQKPDIYRAVELAENALKLPDAQDKPGPREMANRMSRIVLSLFLANCYIEQVIEPCEARTDEESKKWLANAEETVRNIEQFFGSGEDPHVVQWQGMLELAKGNKNIAVRKLYAAYEQLKASGIENPQPSSMLRRSYAQLAYALAKVFRDSSNTGAVIDFLASALKTGITDTNPEALLEYAEVLSNLNVFDAALNYINFFEDQYWTNEESQTLRIKVHIAARQFKEAEEELAKRKPDDPNTIELNLAMVESKIEQLQRVIEQREMEDDLGVIFSSVVSAERAGIESQTAELKSNISLRAELVGKLLSVKPDSVGEASVAAVCDNYITQGNAEQAKDLVNRFLNHSPANTTGLFYKQMLAEPEPAKISQERRKEIKEHVLASIADPTEKSLRLGEFYQENNEPNKASEEFKKVLKIETPQKDAKLAFNLTGEITDSQRLAADKLFEIELANKNWELSEQIAEVARLENLDDCEGQFFAARLAMAKEDYKKVLASIEGCLKQRPIFPRALMLRSRANTALGNENAAIEDARRAAYLNPLDAAIAKELAFVLYRRNEKSSGNVSPDQVIETSEALNRAIALNKDDLVLLSFYAEYIVATRPLVALAIRQKLEKTSPTLPNTILLGRMATRLAAGDDNAERKEALFAIAASSFEKARKIDPNDKLMLVNYAEYLRVSGQEEKARQLLQKSEDQGLLWTYYLREGQFENAKNVLEQLYQTEQKDVAIVKGLLLVAEKTADAEAVKKYSEELLSIEDTIENRLFQIQVFLEVGLIKEAELKLQSFREKYPDETKALLLEAWLAMKQGQLKEALDLTTRSLEATQDDAAAWRLKGQINLLMANYEQAIIDIKKSKSLSDEPATRLALARAYQRAGRGEDAITELEGTIDLPQAPEQARILLEQMYWQLNKTEALEKFYDTTLKKFPDSVDWYNRAGTFALTVGDTEKAEQLYSQAWQKSKEKGPGNSMALEGYFWALITGGKMDKFFEEAGKYVDGDFATATFVKMAEAKLRLGDKETSIQYFRKAIDKAGTDDAAISNILQRMNTLVGADEVLKYCKEKLETNPDSLVANMAMYNLKMTSGEFNSAADYIDKCLKIIGPNAPARADYIKRKAEAFTLAYSKTSDNNYLKKAVTEYESLLAEMPNEPSVLNNLAYLLSEENVRLTEALEYAKRAYEISPNDPGILDTYAYMLYKNSRLQEAAKFLQSALQQYEQNNASAPPDVYEHLGMIKEGLGSVNEAIAAYKQALEIRTGLTETAVGRIKAAIERLSAEQK